MCLGTDLAKPLGSIIRVSNHRASPADLVPPPMDTGNRAIAAIITQVTPTDHRIPSANEYMQDPMKNQLGGPTDQVEDLMDQQMEDLTDDGVVDLTNKEAESVNCWTGVELPNPSKSRKFKRIKSQICEWFPFTICLSFLAGSSLVEKPENLEIMQKSILQGQQRIFNKLDVLENVLHVNGWPMSHMDNPSATSPYAAHRLPPSTWAHTPWQKKQATFHTPQSQYGMTSAQVQQDAASEHQPVRTFVTCSNDKGPTNTIAPSCHPLPDQSSDSDTLSSEMIMKDKLAAPQAIVLKYHKLRGDALAGTLAVKLAREAYFGPEIMKLCTVRGNRGFPGLPHAEL